MKNFLNWRIISAVLIILIGAVMLINFNQLNRPKISSNLPASMQIPGPVPVPAPPANNFSASGLAQPISNAISRITKKPFGIYISPQDSPVIPERFTGYHTGTDFETLPGEQNIDLPIMAICSGTLKIRGWASGYGGYAVQNCTIDNQAVTVIYGHLRQSSISEIPGQQITAGQQIAVLGTGYSNETDGERKHLHLGIHKGTTLNIRGYVQNKADLSGWIDWQSLKDI